ncbi:hypothetical protein JXA80_05505 [bacterium]|nr:hypothetical protein [candidate division CSSED10-310 bacterium]
MWTNIMLSIVIVTIAGAAFALTSLKLGRGDRRTGCGAGRCAACNPDAHPDTACPTPASDEPSMLSGMPSNRPRD